MFKKAPPIAFSILVFIILFSGSLTACSGNSASASNDKELTLASLDSMPSEVKSAPTLVQQAYQFAAANPDILHQIPCYCGCGKMGHTSNYSCYIQSVDDKGLITFDIHGLGCSICVDITQDTMRLSNQGKTVVEIKAYIDQNYSEYGPSNLPSQ